MTQSKALEIMKSGKNVFLTGEPGSGKSYTVNLFREWCRRNGKVCAVTASTGIAATHIDGITIHSFCGMGIKDDFTDGDLYLLSQKKYVMEKVEAADVLIIDEVSMLNGHTLDNVDRILRFLRDTNLQGIPFGGLQVIFVGDFFQLPPVVKGKRKMEYTFESASWEQAAPVVCYLTEQHRQSDAKFLDILKAMRDGKVTKAHKTTLIAANKENIPPTRLFTHNVEVDQINEMALKQIKEKPHTYKMTSEGIPYLIEILKKSCMSPDLLTLKLGAEVMFTRNNFDEGYVNGTQGIIVDFNYDDLPVVITRDGRKITPSYAEWSIEDTKAVISQLPLRLAWAITVHKSQGMSLDAATVDLSKAFEYGQGYVAISRVRTLAGLHVHGLNDKALEMHPRVAKADKKFREMSALLEK